MTNPKTQTPSELTNSLTKISVSQILSSTGFKSAKSSALDTLSRIASLFLRHLTTSAASRSVNPSLNDLLSALQDLNSPLDFSIPRLTRFISNSNPIPFPFPFPFPFPCKRGHQALTALPQNVTEKNNCNCDFMRKRGPEVPSWLPAFPQMATDNNNYDNYNDEDGKGHWEERWRDREAGKVPALAVKEKVVEKTKRGVKRDVMVYGRRERLKFKFGVNRKTKDGNVGDLEMRNGVCRGGKRICLIKRVDCSRFFGDNDDDK